MTENIHRWNAGSCLPCSTLMIQVALADTDPWSFKVTPYLWNVNFDGTTSSGGNDAPVDTDYSFFTLDNLDNALFLAFEANNGRYDILSDGLRARYSDTATISVLNTQLAVETGFIEGAVSYRPSPLEHLARISHRRARFHWWRLLPVSGYATCACTRTNDRNRP